MKYHKGYNLLVIGALSLLHTCVVSAAYNKGPEGEVPGKISVGDNEGKVPGTTSYYNEEGYKGEVTGTIPDACNKGKEPGATHEDASESEVLGPIRDEYNEGSQVEGTTSNEYTYDIKRNPFIYENYTKILIATFIVLLIEVGLWERKFGIIIPNKSGFGGKSPFICVKSVGVPMIVLALYMFLAEK